MLSTLNIQRAQTIRCTSFGTESSHLDGSSATKNRFRATKNVVLTSKTILELKRSFFRHRKPFPNCKEHYFITENILLLSMSDLFIAPVDLPTSPTIFSISQETTGKPTDERCRTLSLSSAGRERAGCGQGGLLGGR